MFTLLKGFYDYYTRRPSFNILIIGLDSAGKTTLLEQIKSLLAGKPGESSDIIKTSPTVGLNGIQCQFWDLGGGGDLRRLWPKYFPEAHLLFFVIDGADLNRAKEVCKVFEHLNGEEGQIYEGFEGLPMAILINKSDLFVEEGDDVAAVIKVKESFNPLFSAIEARESKVFTLSALKGDGIIAALEWSLGVVEKNVTSRPPNFV